MSILTAVTIVSVTENAEKISDVTGGCLKFPGYVPLFWDAGKERMLMEIKNLNKEILYQVSLQAGVGVNNMGLDRGQLGDTRVIIFRRVGKKLFMEQPNYRHRDNRD